MKTYTREEVEDLIRLALDDVDELVSCSGQRDGYVELHETNLKQWFDKNLKDTQSDTAEVEAYNFLEIKYPGYTHEQYLEAIEICGGANLIWSTSIFDHRKFDDGANRYFTSIDNKKKILDRL